MSGFVTHRTRYGREERLPVRGTARQAAPAQVEPLAVWNVNDLRGEALHEAVRPLDVDVAVVCASLDGGRWAREWVGSVEMALSSINLVGGLIVVEEGDSSPETVGQWEDVLRRCSTRHIRLRRTVGPGAARNIGVRCLTDRCKYLVFLDADDRLEPEALHKLISAAEKHKADVVWGRIEYDQDGEIRPETAGARIEALKPKRAREIIGAAQTNPIPLLGTVVRKSAFDAVGGFNEALGHCADWDLWLRMFDAGYKFQPFSGRSPVATYRRHEGQLSQAGTFAAGYRHVPELRQWRQEAARLRSERADRSLAIYLREWSTGGAQAALAHTAEALAERGWAASSIQARDNSNGFRERFGRIGQCHVAGEAESVRLLNQHSARYTYCGDIIPEGTALTHVYYGGDSAWNRTAPPANVRGIYCSEWLRKYLEAARGQRDERGVLIPNPVDVATITQAVGRDVVRRRLQIEPDAMVYLWVGRLVGVKNPAAFARAGKLLRDGAYGRPSYLLVAGPAYGHHFRNDLFAAVVDGKLESRFRWLGNVSPDVMPLVYHAADAMVITSHFEGMSLAMLEGMAAGLPVITTDVGGAREALDEGDCGIIVPRGDHSAIAAQMLRLFFSPGEARAMGAVARRRAGLYDIGSWADRHEIAFLGG